MNTVAFMAYGKNNQKQTDERLPESRELYHLKNFYTISFSEHTITWSIMMQSITIRKKQLQLPLDGTKEIVADINPLFCNNLFSVFYAEKELLLR